MINKAWFEKMNHICIWRMDGLYSARARTSVKMNMCNNSFVFILKLSSELWIAMEQFVLRNLTRARDLDDMSNDSIVNSQSTKVLQLQFHLQ